MYISSKQCNRLPSFVNDPDKGLKLKEENQATSLEFNEILYVDSNQNTYLLTGTVEVSDASFCMDIKKMTKYQRNISDKKEVFFEPNNPNSIFSILMQDIKNLKITQLSFKSDNPLPLSYEIDDNAIFNSLYSIIDRSGNNMSHLSLKNIASPNMIANAIKTANECGKTFDPFKLQLASETVAMDSEFFKTTYTKAPNCKSIVVYIRTEEDANFVEFSNKYLQIPSIENPYLVFCYSNIQHMQDANTMAAKLYKLYSNCSQETVRVSIQCHKNTINIIRDIPLGYLQNLRITNQTPDVTKYEFFCLEIDNIQVSGTIKITTTTLEINFITSHWIDSHLLTSFSEKFHQILGNNKPQELILSSTQSCNKICAKLLSCILNTCKPQIIDIRGIKGYSLSSTIDLKENKIKKLLITPKQMEIIDATAEEVHIYDATTSIEPIVAKFYTTNTSFHVYTKNIRIIGSRESYEDAVSIIYHLDTQKTRYFNPNNPKSEYSLLHKTFVVVSLLLTVVLIYLAITCTDSDSSSEFE